jgi:thioredoxin-related protein
MAKHVLVAVLLIAAVFCHAAASDEEGKDVIKLINDKAKPTEDFETQVRREHHVSLSVCFHTVIHV